MSTETGIETFVPPRYHSIISMGIVLQICPSSLQVHEPAARAKPELELDVCGEACRFFQR